MYISAPNPTAYSPVVSQAAGSIGSASPDQPNSRHAAIRTLQDRVETMDKVTPDIRSRY